MATPTTLSQIRHEVEKVLKSKTEVDKLSTRPGSLWGQIQGAHHLSGFLGLVEDF